MANQPRDYLLLLLFALSKWRVMMFARRLARLVVEQQVAQLALLALEAPN